MECGSLCFLSISISQHAVFTFPRVIHTCQTHSLRFWLCLVCAHVTLAWAGVFEVWAQQTEENVEPQDHTRSDPTILLKLNANPALLCNSIPPLSSLQPTRGHPLVPKPKFSKVQCSSVDKYLEHSKLARNFHEDMTHISLLSHLRLSHCF